MLHNEDLRTLEQKIEDAHNKLLSIDQQYSRVQKLHSAKESELLQLQELRLDVENGISVLTVQKDNLTLDVENLSKGKNQLIDQITEAQDELNDVRSEAKKVTTDLHEREISIKQKENELIERENDIYEQEEDLANEREIIGAKHQKIKELVKSL